MTLQRIGILGGTFDPIHYGHLRLAETAREAYALDCVLFVPNAVSPFKTNDAVSFPEARLAMAELATASNSAFCVSRMEIDRPGPSYAIDTVRAIRETYPSLDALYFIVGADAARDLPLWREAETLLHVCRFVAVTRPGVASDSLPEGVDSLPAPGLEISGSDIRRRIREGRSIKYLVPESVEEFILSQKLYSSP